MRNNFVVYKIEIKKQKIGVRLIEKKKKKAGFNERELDRLQQGV